MHRPEDDTRGRQCHGEVKLATKPEPQERAWRLALKSYKLAVGLQEMAMATHSSTLAWKIPWTEEPGRLQSMGSLRVGHV